MNAPKNSTAAILQIHQADPDADKRRLKDLLHALAEAEVAITYVSAASSVSLSFMSEDSQGIPVFIELHGDGRWELKTE